MKRRSWLLAMSMLMFSVFASAAWAQGQEVTVSIEDNFFDKAEITVEPGTTVTWVQHGQYGHTTTSYDGLWDSGLIEGGTEGTYSYTFEEPGTYEYFCRPHEEVGMVGTVTVSASAEAEPLADTGGVPLALVAALLLAGSGLMTFALLRRGGAS